MSSGGCTKTDRRRNAEEVARRRAEHERQLELWREQLRKEQEERLKRVTAMREKERLKRQREVHEKELMRQKAALDRRTAALQEEKEKKEVILARAHAVASRLAVQQKTKPVYAFGSSTPRGLDFWEKLSKEQKINDRRLQLHSSRDPPSTTSSRNSTCGHPAKQPRLSGSTKRLSKMTRSVCSTSPLNKKSSSRSSPNVMTQSMYVSHMVVRQHSPLSKKSDAHASSPDMAKSQTYHTTHVAHYVSSRSRENLASRPPLPYRSHPKPSSGRDSESYTLIRRSSSRELRTHVDHRFNDSKSHTFRSSPNGTSKTFIKTKKSYNELRNPASKNVEDSKGSSKRVVTPNAVKDGGRKSSSSEAVNSKIFENQVVSADDKMHLQDGSECLEKAHEEGNVKSEDLIKNTGDGTSSPELNSERHANDDKVPVNDANTGALIDLSEGEKRRCISDQMYPTTVDDESDQGLFAEMHRAEASSVLGQSLFAELRQAGESVMLDEGNTDAVVDMPKTAVENVDIDGISHIVGLSGYSAVAAGEEGGSSEEELGVILANSRMSANENFNVSGKETSKVSLAQERGESHLHVSEGLGSSSVSVSTAPNLNVGNLNVRNSEGSQESVSSHLPFEVGQEGSSSERLTAVCPSLQNKGMKGQTESTGSHLEEFVNGGEDDVRVRLTEERRKAIQERYDRNQRERDERRARLSAIMNRTRGSPVIFAETKASAKEDSKGSIASPEKLKPITAANPMSSSILQKLAAANPRLMSALHRNGSNTSLANELADATHSMTLPGQVTTNIGEQPLRSQHS